MTLNRVFSGVIAASLIILWGLFASVGANELIDLLSALLLTAQLLWLLLILNVGPERQHPVLLLFAMITFFFFPLRTMALIIDPGGVLEQYRRPATVGDMNNALTYVLLGMVFVTAGILLGGGLARRWQRISPKMDTPSNGGHSARRLSLTAASLLMFAAEFIAVFAYLRLGIGRATETAHNLSHAWKVFYSLMNIDACLFALLGLLFTQWQSLSTRAKLLPCLAVAGYVLTRVAISSKSAVIQAILIGVLLMLSRDEPVRINRKMIAVALPLLVVSVLSFNAARAVRLAWQVSPGRQLTLHRIYETVAAVDAQAFLNPMALWHRAQGIDPMLNVVSDRGVDLDGRVNVLRESTSLANRLIPSHPFRIPLMAQEYEVVYGDATESLYLDYGAYTTHMWTVWGESYVLFGAVAGLFASAAATAIITAVYNTVGWKAGAYKIFARSLCLYALYWTLLSFGVDFLVLELLTVGVSLMFFLWILRLLSSIRIRVFEPAT